jgi:hypothetical protein
MLSRPPTGRFPNVYQWEFYQDPWVIDQEWDNPDEDDRLVAFYAHEIDTCGAVLVHPDGDRLNPRVDPVPLHSHVPDGGSYAEFVSEAVQRAEWAAYVLRQKDEEAFLKAQEEKRRQYYEAEAARYRESAEAQDRQNELAMARARAMLEPYQQRYQQRPTPKPIEPPRFHHSEPLDTPEVIMLRNLRINEPLSKGVGRVWMNLVMLNEGDWDNPAFTHQPGWTEIWRGEGYVIFRRLLPGLGDSGPIHWTQ